MHNTRNLAPDEQPLTLEALELYARWGFADGQILERYFHAFSVDGYAKPTSGDYAGDCLIDAVLVELVKIFLIPRAPSGFAFDLYTTHNPIRADIGDEPLRKEAAPAWAHALAVAVSPADIYRTMTKVWGSEHLPADRCSGVTPPRDFITGAHNGPSGENHG